MKNLSKIPLKIVIQTIPKLSYLKYLKILGRYDFRDWAYEKDYNWQSNATTQKFIEWLDKQNRLQELYKDIMNEISSEINSKDITKDITEED